MSYGMPGMRIYDFTADAPSGVSDIPAVQQRSAVGLPGAGGTGAHVSYAASLDIGPALLIFAVCWFGATGWLHYLSNAAGKL